MNRLASLANAIVAESHPEGLSPLAEKYFDMVSGGCPAGQGPVGFREYYQNAGDTGGPASPGGAFWQQVVVCGPVEADSIS